MTPQVQVPERYSRSARSWVVVIGVIASCHKSGEGPPNPPITTPPPPQPSADADRSVDRVFHCERQPFAESTPVPEASGATWIDVDGKPSLLVTSDSGNHGAYGIVDAATGSTVEQGQLPLGGASDDVEGLAARNGLIYGITSSGWILVWQRQGRGFVLRDGPYALGPVDLPDAPGGMGNHPPEGDGMVCPLKRTNCGRNYEGLCLIAGRDPATDCIGFAAAKADGHLYCVVDHDGQLAVDRTRAIPITKPGRLADCTFDGTTLYAGNNSFGGATVFRIDGWQDSARAQVVAIGDLVIGFPEVLAVGGEVFYRMSDFGGSPSALAKYRCAAP